MSNFDPDDVAYGIVEDYLLAFPNHDEIINAVLDNGGTIDDVDSVALTVRKSLTEIARTFSLTY